MVVSGLTEMSVSGPARCELPPRRSVQLSNWFGENVVWDSGVEMVVSGGHPSCCPYMCSFAQSTELAARINK